MPECCDGSTGVAWLLCTRSNPATLLSLLIPMKEPPPDVKRCTSAVLCLTSVGMPCACVGAEWGWGEGRGSRAATGCFYDWASGQRPGAGKGSPFSFRYSSYKFGHMLYNLIFWKFCGKNYPPLTGDLMPPCGNCRRVAGLARLAAPAAL